MPAWRQRQVDAIARETLASLGRRRRRRLVALERKRRQDAVHVGERSDGGRLIRTRGDGDAIDVSGSGDVATGDGDEAAAASGPRRWGSKIGAVELDRQGGALLAHPEVTHVDEHLSSAANSLPRDLAHIVVVRRKREGGGVEDRSALCTDQDPGTPAAWKFEREP